LADVDVAGSLRGPLFSLRVDHDQKAIGIRLVDRPAKVGLKSGAGRVDARMPVLNCAPGSTAAARRNGASPGQSVLEAGDLHQING